jgi:hypothetical protein
MTRKKLSVLVPLALLMAIPTLAEAGLGCAQFISSSRYDRPMWGHLVGEEVITLEKDVRGKVRAGGKALGGEAEGGTKVSRTFSVGVYEFTDGTRMKMDCRDYTRWG